MIILENAFMSVDEFINKLVPNGWSTLIQLLALIVLIIFVIIFAYKPVKKMLKKRQDYIENNIRESEEAKAAAIIKEREVNELVLERRKEADQIIASAKDAAEIKKAEILDSAAQEANEIREKAIEQIRQEELEAKESIRKEMVDIALDASSLLLKREISSEDNKRLVEDFIKDIE